MTREEQLKFCSVCKNRKMDMHQGMLCELTSAKADFDSTCPNYDEDAKEKAKNERIEKEYQETLTVSGWLAFFLWFGIGVGALMSCVMIIGMIPTSGYSFFGGLLEVLSILCLVAIAVLTIKAFYQKKPNAVALAKTYIAMIALDGVCSILYYIIFEEPLYLAFALQPLLWSSIWFLYLTLSTQVENMIPKTKRVWEKTEKIILGIYALSCLLVVVISACSMNNPSKSVLYNQEALIDATIEAANEELPNYSDPLVTQLKLVKENDNIVYAYKINNLTETLDEMTTWELALSNKQEMLAAVAVEEDQDVINSMKLCFDGGYNICYRYLYANGNVLYNIVINSEEYNNALQVGANFKCDDQAYQSLLDYYTSLLPVEYMGDAVLLNIQHSTNALTYYVQLPEMSEYDLIFIDQKYLKEYLVENWEALDDNLKSLAKLNGEDIIYRFFTSDGDEHCVVRLTKDDYLALEQ